jgi:hypothetical protein
MPAIRPRSGGEKEKRGRKIGLLFPSSPLLLFPFPLDLQGQGWDHFYQWVRAYKP